MDSKTGKNWIICTRKEAFVAEAKRLSFAVSVETYSAIEANAKKENRSIANYMRTVIEKLLAKKEK
ncbi:MAG TPA: hypothetical protein PK079_23430 [Leptospiraceae bacterium]|nr:hypothetical protein [Leptospiraceae bacterium]HMW07607.1 hypothetical protein [Leptospiraceae bacterium]HMX33015.1 hypothetical protein [Leptospiraceae bacterium]HMY33274.1 hypothetical protein [Leptospiraceae bacterium]HMZ67283.1 hypothetical protein [Leptospiraceae bacterium]